MSNEETTMMAADEATPENVKLGIDEPAINQEDGMGEASDMLHKSERPPSLQPVTSTEEEHQKSTTTPEEADTSIQTNEQAMKVDEVTTTAENAEGAASENAVTTAATTNTYTTNVTNKIMIYNVLKFVRPRELQKMTKSWELAIPNLKVLKYKKPPQCNWVLITVESPDMVPGLVQHINQNQNRRGKPLRAVAVTEEEEEKANGDNNDDDDVKDMDNGEDRSSSYKKRRASDRDSDDRNSNSKRGKGDATTTTTTATPTMTIPSRFDTSNDIVTPRTEEQIKDAITPLWKLSSYEEQLDTKVRELVKKCARKIIHEIKGRFRMLEREAKRNTRREVTPIYSWLEGQGPDRPAIRVNQVIASPQTKEYRNKCEFTFGYRYEWDEAVAKVAATAITNTNNDLDMEPNENESAPQIDGEQPLTHDEKAPPPKQEQNATETDATTPTKMANEDSNVPSRTIRRVPAVGCMASGWSGGVSRPHPCQNIPTEACAVVDIIDNFLSTSPIPPYQQRSHSGSWRLLTMRMSRRTRQCMVLIQHASPSGGGTEGRQDYSDVWESERQRLIDMLTTAVLPTHTRNYEQGGTITVPSGEQDGNNESSTLRVTSIFFQEFDGLSTPPPEHPVQHAYGSTHIEEILGHCAFQISPGAFFQVNTEAAEKLYQIVVDRVREVSENPEETILLDICCGTGTIGITCLKEGVVGRVLGVDVSVPAIENAKRNAEMNGFQTHDNLKSKGSTRFVASRAEHVIAKELAKIRDTVRDAAIVAVVDPARDGLHADVVATIRSNEKIQRLIYVSCNPTATLVRDAALLCAPPTKKYPGRAFRPVSSQPVDMFPLTPHCEMVMTFERLSEDEAANKNGTGKTNDAPKKTKSEAKPKSDGLIDNSIDAA